MSAYENLVVEALRSYAFVRMQSDSDKARFLERFIAKAQRVEREAGIPHLRLVPTSEEAS